MFVMKPQPTALPQPGSKPNKHELRTRETRELLLRAAETIFIRDGYSGADLDEIAALAGRTKGAIYGHFKSKEDIFMAMIEQRREAARTRMYDLMASATTVEDNVAAFRKFYLEQAQDEGWAILMMEFKLFTLRQPKARKRLLEFRAENAGQESRYAALLGKSSKGKNAISRTLAIHSILLMLTALLLEKQLEPDLLNPQELKKILERLYSTFIETP
jgi:AcrR family transcriptional regulator